MKSIAALLMLIDHIGVVFFPYDLRWRMIGRLAMPIFAYGVARGAYYTGSLERYMKKMLLFALVSQMPYWLMSSGIKGEPFFKLKLNVGFTFLFALLGIYGIKKLQMAPKKVNALLGSIGCVWLAQILNCDYGSYGVLLVWMSYFAFVKQKPIGYVAAGYIVLTFLSYGMYIKIFWLQSVGVLGYGVIGTIGHLSEKKWGKIFYIFYPLHMAVLCGIKWWLNH